MLSLQFAMRRGGALACCNLQNEWVAAGWQAELRTPAEGSLGAKP